MRSGWRLLPIMLSALLAASSVRADDPPVERADIPRAAGTRLEKPEPHPAPELHDENHVHLECADECIPPPPPPGWLPEYSMDIRLHSECRRADIKQVVKWTNPTNTATSEMVVHVYPRHKPNKKQLALYERTIESLRLDPRVALDKEGRRIHFHRVESEGGELPCEFDEENDTIMRIKLPRAVGPGETIEVKFDYYLDIPPVQGRLGNYLGVTNMLNFYPLVAYYSDKGWDEAPFVGWHQPWFNEAANYFIRLTLPSGEIVASGAQVVGEKQLENGEKLVELAGRAIRDLAIVASKRFEEHHGEVDGVKLRVVAFPEHRFYAKFALEVVRESFALYNRWFGRYPYPYFTIAEAYFGWNGNETGGMVLIDERVFEAPHLGSTYIDSLIGHEVCHQWWYGAVGTDGYRQSFMDEGLVSFVNAVRIEHKYGQDPSILHWPKFLGWMPNIPYRTLQHYGYTLYYQRGGRKPVLEDLNNMDHLHNLFFLAYDRGSRVFSMVHQRMGDEKFFQFMRKVYAKHCYRVLFFEQFQQDLEEFTGESWQQFFDDWLKSAKVADYKIENASVREVEGGFETTVNIVQLKEINEVVQIGYRTDKKGRSPPQFTLRPEAKEYQEGTARIRKMEPNRWEVVFTSPERPKQIQLDPDQRILDSNPKNNFWKFEPQIRATPFYTPIDEIPITRDLDRPSIFFGPNVDEEGRMGLRGSLIYPARFRVSPFIAYTYSDPQTTAGIDAEIYNIPGPNWSIGARLERTIATGLYDDPYNQGRLYLRYTQFYTTSYLIPNLAFGEVYLRAGDNFFPDEDVRQPVIPGVEDYRNIRVVGATYHLYTQMPYWNPEKGFAFDVTYEYGFKAFNAGESMQQAWSQVSGVHLLPAGLGYFSDTRIAARLAGGYGGPNNGEHFRFGGPLRFRGMRSEDKEGNAFWIGSLDWRFPVFPDLDINIYDRVAAWRSLYCALLYDVGSSYLFDNSQGIDHAVGAGAYFRLAIMSFVEQLTVRVEYAYSLTTSNQVCWLGIYHAF